MRNEISSNLEALTKTLKHYKKRRKRKKRIYACFRCKVPVYRKRLFYAQFFLLFVLKS